MKDSQKPKKKRLFKKNTQKETVQKSSKVKKNQKKPIVEKKEKAFSFPKLSISFVTRHLRVWYLLVFLIPLNIVLCFSLFQLYVQSQNYSLSEIDGVRVIDAKEYPALLKDGGRLDLSSRAYVIYEKDSRVVVAEKNSHLRFAPASSAKIMTALVALEEYSLDEVLPANNVTSVVGSKMGLFEGEKISVENLLYGLMLPSGNDAAYVLASNYKNGYLGFVQRMNEKAEELDLVNTHFVDPAGLDDRNFTTAQEMARLASIAYENEKLREIVGTSSKLVYDASGQIPHQLRNLNELLGQNGINGFKTGFTEEAGGVLVTTAVVNNKTFIFVVFKSDDRFADTKELVNEVIQAVKLVTY